MIKEFMKHHYRHFNAAVCVDAAEAYTALLKKNGKMFVTLAGAMSTAELGISLAEMIRQDKIHAICCTGANLEEDVFNLVAHSHYKRVPHYRLLSNHDDKLLHDSGMNRVTDTCIPEEEAVRRMEKIMLKLWSNADQNKKRYFPYEFLYQLFETHELDPIFEIDIKDSWLYAAWKKNLPIFTPGWEDSTLGNIFTAHVVKKDLSNFHIVKTGVEAMASLMDWYRSTSSKHPIGFFQVGGGIAGDFPICVVPLLRQDLHEDIPLWSYFCQISDSTTSYGSYSGATPNEKITWGKLHETTPGFVIESDATIVAPLVFAYILETSTKANANETCCCCCSEKS
jgi:deoxyhypusine synthase